MQAQGSLRSERPLPRALPGVPPRRPREKPAEGCRAVARGQECRAELVEMLEMLEEESNGERVEVWWGLQPDVRESEDYSKKVETGGCGIERGGRTIDICRRLPTICSGLR